MSAGEITEFVNSGKVNEFDLERTDVGSKKILTIGNMKISRRAKVVVFEVSGIDEELSLENNRVEINLDK